VSSAPDAVVSAAIRPEKINIFAERPDQAENIAQGIVKEIAYLGDMSVYLVQLASGKIVRVTQPNTYRHAEATITWEQQVFLSWHASSPVVLSE
jgi:putrescine transport system ATP-binding protein